MGESTSLKPKILAQRSSEEIDHWTKIRDDWASNLDPVYQFQKLFDHIPGLYFFAKNREGRFMFVSKGLHSRYSMKDGSEILGMTDFDINPDIMARNAVNDDHLLFEGGGNVVEHDELWWDGKGTPDWYMATKVALRDREGTIQGVMGILRRRVGPDHEIPIYADIAKAVKIIRRDFATSVTISEVAQSCGHSVRQLQRRFQTVFGVSPQDFLIKTRIQASIRMLQETNQSTADISEECGFADSSSYIRHFRKHMGVTPNGYRRGKR